ncbi:hypothetical protein OCU04_007874 [Sclerotinia nivalis]|uniref:Uncharacterized protein n=1 Tax=Sclerotinia nivalis TaxID=352851 RepID=A0A9X0AN46_9HELO|nr:hypothetical protein OCU04_007874 [Sclerotinia nivalis]
MTKTSEATVFDKLPLIRSLFDLKLNGMLKDSKDQLCYDPEHAKTDKPALPKVPGKIVYMYDLIESKFQHCRPGYDRIAKWNISTLWTLVDCLVRFLDGKPLPPDSKMGRAEKHWAIELESIELLAIYLGNTEIKDKGVRSALISYMRRIPALEPARSESRLDQKMGTLKRANAAKVEERKKFEIVDLTDDKIPDQVKLKKKTQWTPSSQKLNKDQLTSILKKLEKESQPLPAARNAKEKTQVGSPLQKPKKASHPTPTLQKLQEETQPKSTMQKSKEANKSTPAQQKSKKPTQSDTNLHKPNKPTPPIPTVQKSKKASQPSPTKQKSKKPNQSATTRQNLSPMPTDAYIRLNETYPRVLHVKIASVMKGSGLIGRLLEDLYLGAFAAGDMSKVVGKNRRGKPTLLWDEVMKCFSVPGNMVEKMLSWGEDDRWAPMVMFVERCQLDRALWQKWNKQDLVLAKYFDTFVKASVCASEN